MLAYLIPGENGELSEGSRRVNWVWYCNVNPGGDYSLLFTDKQGKTHANSVPKGLVSKEAVSKLKNNAAQLLPPQFVELIEATPDPFIQAIFDADPDHLYSGRVVLVGDAGFTVRPHTASGVSKAAADAMSLHAHLQNCSDLDLALRTWEEAQLPALRHLSEYGKMIGNRSQFPTV
jgi:2-polyprenyl-6-methoxyphenol hydroxylase-like FAD-dependent oxidoreductase